MDELASGAPCYENGGKRTRSEGRMLLTGRVALCSVLVLWASRPTWADMNEDLAGCAAITKSAARLECYDGLAAKIAPTARTSTPSVEGAGKWSARTEVSPVDDSINVYLHLDAENTIAGKFGNETRPTMTIRCKENETALYISWDTFMGSDDTDVLIRLDKEKARTMQWGISTDHGSTFHTNSIPFIKEMLKHEMLLARTTPYGERPVTALMNPLIFRLYRRDVRTPAVGRAGRRSLA